jgi:hypothetical protein
MENVEIHFVSIVECPRVSSLIWFLDIAVRKTGKDLFVARECKWVGISELFCIGFI